MRTRRPDIPRLLPVLCGLLAALAAMSCSGQEPPPPAAAPAPPDAVAGSSSCRECHEDFYRKWEGSRHGRAMQVVTPEFVAALLAPQAEAVEVAGVRYRADIGARPPVLREEGPGGARDYPLAHALGGKNVFYFLTPIERGRLQVVPLAFDVAGKQWFDATASMVRHASEVPVDWRDPLLTFNTSCHGCHVSQLSTNYDEASDSYRTTWAEPGISCETCHNAAGEHVRIFREAARSGAKPEDPALLRYKGLDPDLSTATCAPCHARSSVLSEDYRAGEKFFDHFSLVAFEDPDFYPDGRDRGENYTYTGWLMSDCVRYGHLACIDCHTSSGRNRFAGEDANRACAACHAERVENAAAHHRHPPGGPGSHCVDCHMPKTSFARMTRSDHSMRPPMPAATIRFGSPNACNICHEDRDAAWADRIVREWHADDYQAPTLLWAGWIEAARKHDFSDLSVILAFLADERSASPVVAASLIRLLASCPDPSVDPALIARLGDRDPLLRSAAAEAVADRGDPGAADALLSALADDCRAVRLAAVTGLAAMPPDLLPPPQRALLETASADYVAHLRARPDQWGSHYNLGNWYLAKGRVPEAVAAFERAAALRPDAEMPLVNASIAYARLGRLAEAEAKLRRALEVRPGSAPALYNLGLLLVERGDRKGAEAALRAAVAADPTLHAAACNLGVLLAEGDLEEGIRWCRRAFDLRPTEPKYAWTLAFYLAKAGQNAEAVRLLEGALRSGPPAAHLFALLGEIHEASGDRKAAAGVYDRAARNEGLSPEVRAGFEARRRALLGR